MANSASKIFTVSGFYRVGGCISPVTCKDLFRSRQEAAAYIAGEVNDRVEDEGMGDDFKVTAKDCTKGYRLSICNDDDDVLELAIVEHQLPPVHAVLTFGQDDRSLNITTFNTAAEAQKRVASNAKSYCDCCNIEYLTGPRGEMDESDIRDSEEYVQAETTGGDFMSWSHIEIPVIKTIDLNVQ